MEFFSTTARGTSPIKTHSCVWGLWELRACPGERQPLLLWLPLGSSFYFLSSPGNYRAETPGFPLLSTSHGFYHMAFSFPLSGTLSLSWWASETQYFILWDSLFFFLLELTPSQAHKETDSGWPSKRKSLHTWYLLKSAENPTTNKQRDSPTPQYLEQFGWVSRTWKLPTANEASFSYLTQWSEYICL